MNKFFLCISSISMAWSVHASWVEKTLHSMSLEEKIAQLIMPGVRLNCPDSLEEAHEFVKKYHFGGLLLVNVGNGFLQGARITEYFTPDQQQRFIKGVQEESKYPLLIAQDLEWGLAMRLRNCMSFPRTMTLGAVTDDHLIYRVAYEIGRQARLVGVHINFAPVVDVNNNPSNPVIHMRSFGEDPDVVAKKAYWFMQGLQEAGIVSCAKHFPGHGNTEVDSHEDLPVLMQTKKQLHDVELFPYKKLIKVGIPMIMTAHLHVPALDAEKNIPASLSKAVCTTLLKEELGFRGIVVTDGLRMGGVTKHFTSAQAAVRAFLAGNDILLDSEDPIQALSGIKHAVEVGIIQELDIDIRVKKVLQLKKFLKLHKKRITDELYDIQQDAYSLKEEVYRHAVTLVRDPARLLPVRSNTKYAFIQSPGRCCVAERVFFRQVSLQNYTPDEAISGFAEQVVIIPFYGLNNSKENNYGISQSMQELMHVLLISGKKLIIILFGTPYALQALPDAATVIVAYEEDADAQEAAVKCCVGEYEFNGTLPILRWLQKNI